MAEDWRVSVSLQEVSHAGRLLGVLHAHEVEEDARKQLGGRVAVSGSGNLVFLYADTEGAARQAEQVVGQVLSAHGMKGTFKLDRWHHAEEEWEDASVPLPSTAAEQRVEHERLERQEAAEAQATGLAEWEVRIELVSHRDAVALAKRLKQEGFEDVVRRWRYLLVGTADEDDAHALAERLKGESPAEATIHVEPGGGMAWQLMPRNPFAVFGGLGG
jgi:hypothetical protein